MRQENPPSFHGVKMEKTYPEADQMFQEIMGFQPAPAT